MTLKHHNLHYSWLESIYLLFITIRNTLYLTRIPLHYQPLTSRIKHSHSFKVLNEKVLHLFLSLYHQSNQGNIHLIIYLETTQKHILISKKYQWQQTIYTITSLKTSHTHLSTVPIGKNHQSRSHYRNHTFSSLFLSSASSQ